MFISFEGIDGSGKTSIIKAISKWLKKIQKPHLTTREPGGCDLSERIRQVVFAEEGACANTQLLLMFAARHEHIQKVIQPALEQGKWVLCDRFTDSTYAYQVALGGADMELADQLALMIHGDLWPRLTFWLDLPVEYAFKRSQQRGTANFFDELRLNQLTQLRECYYQRWRLYPNRIIRIDASQDFDRVVGDIQSQLAALHEC